jgi:hypothetical protein
VPGAEAEVAGLRLRAEGGNDRRGRLRITTVTVRPVSAQSDSATRQPPTHNEHHAGADPPQEASDTSA